MLSFRKVFRTSEVAISLILFRTNLEFFQSLLAQNVYQKLKTQRKQHLVFEFITVQKVFREDYSNEIMRCHKLSHLKTTFTSYL